MKRFLKPHWIFWLITLPQLLLITLYFFSYQIIGSLLSAENLQYWYLFGGMLLTACSLNTVYALIQMKRNQSVHALFGLFLLVMYIPYLYFFGWCSEDIIPRSVPRWMMFGDDLLLYVFTFLIPALAYGVFLIVLGITPDKKAVRPWTDFLMAVAIPAIWYLIFNVLSFLRHHGPSRQIFEHLLAVMLISGTVVFFVFLIRGVYIVFLKNSIVNSSIRLFLKVLIVIIFPLMGLALNNGLWGTQMYVQFIFGDFSHPMFYILALVNGILLCLPKPQSLRNQLFLFTARSITFSYIVYFFLVFLPYLPLSIPAIIVVGAGFLMLTPLLVFIVQAQTLTIDYQFLQKYFNTKLLAALFVLSVLSLPMLLIASYHDDRQELHKALDYVYAPDFEEKTEIDGNIIAKMILHVRENKENNRFWGQSHQPYLTNFYQWFVLDNQTLSDRKLNLLEGIFTGEETAVASSFNDYQLEERNVGVSIDSLHTTSTYHEEEDYWTSWVHFDITNCSNRQDEFRTSFELPIGAWVSDYYLVVENEKKYGILAEKKAAMWVYQQIVNTRRDPGILYYLKGNELAFRVFPMNIGETRHTGFELIHKEPIVLNIEEKTLTLGYSAMQNTLKSKVKLFDDQIIYLPAAVKADLPKVTRRPVYHFLLDCSVGKAENVSTYSETIHQFLKKNDIPFSDVRLLPTNYQTQIFDYEPNWEQKLKNVDFEGGFFVERAMQSVLWRHHQTPSDTYPVFVLVTPNMNKAIFTGKLTDFQFMLPEYSRFVCLQFSENEEIEVSGHYLWGNPHLPIGDFNESQISEVTVLAYPDAENPVSYIADNQEASIVVKKDVANVLITRELDRKNWDNALALQALHQDYILHTENQDAKWLSLVQQSFRTHIMSPFTSFMVVENEAQEAALMEKQRQVLNAKASLDTIEEDMKPMSEPVWWVLLLFAGLLVSIRRLNFGRERKEAKSKNLI
ncbi:MAG: MSEP-CTERM sorting domain-containing protein [Chitinophagales bacterium]